MDLKLMSLAIFAVLFIAFILIVGRLLRTKGKVFLDHTFRDEPAVAEAVHFLLNLGFYLAGLGLLLWNLGLEPSGTWVDQQSRFVGRDLVYSVALRLGVSVFVVAALHTLNVLILSVLNSGRRKGAGV